MSLIKLAPYIIDSTLDFTFNNVTATGNLVSLNANLGNLATANYFSGSGNNLSNIQAANITGTIGSNGLSLSVANPGGGAAVTMSDWLPMQMAASSNTSFAQNTLLCCSAHFPDMPINTSFT